VSPAPARRRRSAPCSTPGATGPTASSSPTPRRCSRAGSTCAARCSTPMTTV